jgi:SNF2 family DNA or RNA helicase
MDMGTGKTKAAIDVIQSDRNLRIVLVVCPLAVIPEWENQIKIHAPDSFIIWNSLKYPGTSKFKADRLSQWRAEWGRCATEQRFLILINYEMVWRGDLGKLLLNYSVPDAVIYDESHRIKSHTGKASKFCYKLSQETERCLLLTGTPMPHSRLDIFAQARCIDPGVFGTSFTSFRNYYFDFVSHPFPHVKRRRNEHDEEFAKRYKLLFYTVKASEVLDLPHRTFTTRVGALEPEAQKVYDDLERDAVSELLNVSAFNPLTKLVRLQQCVSGEVKNDDGVMQHVSDAKYNLFLDFLEDVPPDEPLVIYCKYTQDVANVRRACTQMGRSSSELSGNENSLQEWQDGETLDLVCQIKSGKEGINLTRSRICVQYSLGFSLGDYCQSIKRLHRPGQLRPVDYVHMVIKNTVDMKIMNALAKRQADIESVTEGDDKFLEEIIRSIIDGQ